MAYKKRFDFSSAYGQLILLVFFPICVLAGVGAVLVFSETNTAVRSEQRALAEAALVRYEPVVQQMMPLLLNELSQDEESEAEQDSLQESAIDLANHVEKMTTADSSINASAILDESSVLDDKQENYSRFQRILTSINNENHLQRIAVIDETGRVLITAGHKEDKPWGKFSPQQDLIENLQTTTGTAYGSLLGEYGQGSGRHKYWLFVDMDDEPLHIARYRILLALVVTGLFTILILLLSLNIYAKRWITPIYEMRLYLQRTNTDNLYQPLDAESSGELNQLQQDLVKALRRIHSSFQELKNHAEQTEDDLRVAFDEMEMQNISIRNARDAAVSTSQAKSAFLANISHELRTPLNSIDGFINLLARHGKLTAEQDLYVQTIRKSSAHLLALVNDVLDFSKIEAGKLVLDRHEFSLYDAIYEVMDMLSPLAAEKGLRMAVMFYDDVPKQIVGDALRVKQILTNLVSNAIKFTDMGEVVVRVSLDEGVHETAASRLIMNQSDVNQSKPATESKDQQVDNSSSANDANNTNHANGANNANKVNSTDNANTVANIHHAASSIDNRILIAIQDSGRGISETAQKQLFRSFSQGDPSITRQYGGTGLGLVISKQLTRLMGGNIGFYDNERAQLSQDITGSVAGNVQGLKRPQKGSTFWFTMPANVDVIEMMEQESQATILPQLRPLSDSLDAPLQLLVWIDHVASQQVLKASLRPLPIEMTQASSLASALEWLKEKNNAWDWVIVDGGDTEAQEDMAALLKQIRLHYQGKLAIFGYQVALDNTLLGRYKAKSLYQPLNKRQLYALLDTRKRSQVAPIDTPRWQGVKVLAVDDHLPNLLVLDALLSELGIEVITANSGYDAIEIMSKQQARQQKQSGEKSAADSSKDNIDLIFMDIQMPRLSGHEAAQQIRKIESSGKKTPIIALTAHGLSDERDNLMAAGINDYVGKPISQPQLLQILQKWLGGHAANQGQVINGHCLSVIDSNQTDNNQTYNITEQSNINAAEQTQDKNSLAIFDWQDAMTRSANKPELAAKLALMMIDSVEEELEALQAAWEMRDRAELAQIAHRILGACRYTGVPQLRQASQDFEDKCLLNIQHTTPAQFAMLQPKYDVLLEALHNLQVLDKSQYPELNYDKLSENDMTWKMI
ncbi:response regulator [Psychrobacter sp. I-STPA10]|uniref:response regulator n=1 Tax=Psychrobacter sp. I-STPA10 TaxID=2585769 RepID=UPI001E54A7B4|nr:response regulator [Psychrobacter sp. I-STPA10]